MPDRASVTRVSRPSAAGGVDEAPAGVEAEDAAVAADQEVAQADRRRRALPPGPVQKVRTD